MARCKDSTNLDKIKEDPPVRARLNTRDQANDSKDIRRIKSLAIKC